MKTIFIFITIFLSHTFSSAFAQQTIRVPQSEAPVLIDGKFPVAEWRNCFVISIEDSVKLYLKQYKGHVFIGVRVERATPSYVDLLLFTPDEQLYNLHASMKIGERLLKGNSWTDSQPAWRWGNNIDWIANEAKIDPTKDTDLPFTEKFYPYEGYEFQLCRSRFDGKKWHIRIVVQDFAEQLPDITFPNNSKKTDTSQWAILNLE